MVMTSLSLSFQREAIAPPQNIEPFEENSNNSPSLGSNWLPCMGHRRSRRACATRRSGGRKKNTASLQIRSDRGKKSQISSPCSETSTT
jgi:hypothetical protein